MSHTICHLEIPTTDLKKSGEFYKNLFDWKIDYSFGILVDDIDAMLEKAVKLGAKKVKETTEIPNVGWFGLFTDLDGNTIGLFTPKK